MLKTNVMLMALSSSLVKLCDEEGVLSLQWSHAQGEHFLGKKHPSAIQNELLPRKLPFFFQVGALRFFDRQQASPVSRQGIRTKVLDPRAFDSGFVWAGLWETNSLNWTTIHLVVNVAIHLIREGKEEGSSEEKTPFPDAQHPPQEAPSKRLLSSHAPQRSSS